MIIRATEEQWQSTHPAHRIISNALYLIVHDSEGKPHIARVKIVKRRETERSELVK